MRLLGAGEHPSGCVVAEALSALGPCPEKPWQCSPFPEVVTQCLDLTQIAVFFLRNITELLEME